MTPIQLITFYQWQLSTPNVKREKRTGHRGKSAELPVDRERMCYRDASIGNGALEVALLQML